MPTTYAEAFYLKEVNISVPREVDLAWHDMLRTTGLTALSQNSFVSHVCLKLSPPEPELTILLRPSALLYLYAVQ